jgi:hypothetical protein
MNATVQPEPLSPQGQAVKKANKAKDHGSSTSGGSDASAKHNARARAPRTFAQKLSAAGLRVKRILTSPFKKLAKKAAKKAVKKAIEAGQAKAKGAVREKAGTHEARKATAKQIVHKTGDAAIEKAKSGGKGSGKSKKEKIKSGVDKGLAAKDMTREVGKVCYTPL